MSTTDKQQVIKDIKRLHEEGQDIDSISKEIKAIKEKDNDRIVNGLEAIVDLELLKDKPAGLHFVLACWHGKEAKVYHGIDFDNDRYIAESDESKEYRVFVRGTSLGAFSIVDSRYYTMNRLRKSLEERNIPHYIAYQA